MKVLILGATTNVDRYAYKAAKRLHNAGYDIIPVGIRKGAIFNIDIINDTSIQENVHTVTLYVGPQNQSSWKQYIIDTKPKRVIFNPGTENSGFESELKSKGIEVVINCTLVMLSLNTFRK